MGYLKIAPNVYLVVAVLPGGMGQALDRTVSGVEKEDYFGRLSKRRFWQVIKSVMSPRSRK